MRSQFGARKQEIPMNQRIKQLFFLLFTLVFTTAVSASDVNEQEYSEATHGEVESHDGKGFQASKLIMDHIGDAHDWHIADIDGHAISIPLPVILYSPEKGLDIFMSSRFDHGHACHEGYCLEDGKVIREDGSSFYDFSITKNVLAIILSSILLCLIFISVANKYKRNPASAPRGLQSFVEPLILFVRDEVAKPSIGHKYHKFMPYLLTIFFFIWINNLMGLIPIFPFGANVTGSISVTLVLALFTFVITTFTANKNYWSHIFMTPGVPGWLLPLMIPIEILGMLSKPIVLMLRLFANITAGHIIILAFFSLIFIFGERSLTAGYGVSIASVAFTIFMSVLELLVAFLQAYVFTLLSALYFGMAVEEHH